MPNRIVRDGILTSKRVDHLDEFAEVFYRRLMSVVDDFGRYFGDPVLLQTACFPRRPGRYSDEQIIGWVGQCISAGLLQAYSVNETEYVQLSSFNQRLRENQKSKWPSPEGAECSRNFPEVPGKHGKVKSTEINTRGNLPEVPVSSGSRASATPSPTAPKETTSPSEVTDFTSFKFASFGRDPEFQEFVETYRETGKPLIDKDFIEAHWKWRYMDPEQKQLAIGSLEERIKTGYYSDPSKVHLPANYLDGEYKRKLPGPKQSKLQQMMDAI